MMFHSQFRKIASFLEGLGFSLTEKPVPSGFLPGIRVRGMTMQFDRTRMLSAGDMLHEAGHIAIIPAMFRPKVSDDIDASLGVLAQEYIDKAPLQRADGTEDPVVRGLLQCGETEAQAWSFAAATAIGIPPNVVFHGRAYEGHSREIIAMLSVGAFLGINGLVAGGMVKPRQFPRMNRWLQV